MRVAIDARPMSHPQAGGYRSLVRSLLRGLTERDGDEELLLYVDRPVALPDLPRGARVRVLPGGRLRADLVAFPAQVRRDAPDLVFGPANYLPPRLAAPGVVCVLDTLLQGRWPWQSARTLRQRAVDAYFAAMQRRSVRAARRLATLAHGSVPEIAAAFAVPEGRVAVLPVGLSLPDPSPRVVRSPRGLLALAAPDPRKNVDALLEALTRHADRFGAQGPPPLELVASHPDAASRHAGPGVRVRGGLDDAALADAFAAARVFVFPSRREGFGLPPLEAMRVGTPVVASDAPHLPETLGDAPLYADPERPETIAAAVARLLDDPDLWEERAASGRAWAAAFTCRRQAEATATLWREALS